MSRRHSGAASEGSQPGPWPWPSSKGVCVAGMVGATSTPAVQATVTGGVYGTATSFQMAREAPQIACGGGAFGEFWFLTNLSLNCAVFERYV